VITPVMTDKGTLRHQRHRGRRCSRCPLPRASTDKQIDKVTDKANLPRSGDPLRVARGLEVDKRDAVGVRIDRSASSPHGAAQGPWAGRDARSSATATT
jgi:hypothetical protein